MTVEVHSIPHVLDDLNFTGDALSFYLRQHDLVGVLARHLSGESEIDPGDAQLIADMIDSAIAWERG